MILRHGDLSFRKISGLPKGKFHKKVNSFVLAEGEYTGHNHNLVALNGASIAVIEDGEDLFFQVENGKAELTHPEHKTITFEPGVYHMKREREFDYFLNETKKVLD